MDSVLIPALRELREDIQATNKSVKELREEFEAIVPRRSRHVTALILFRQTHVKIGEHNGLKNQLERLTEKMTDMEDRCRRN